MEKSFKEVVNPTASQQKRITVQKAVFQPTHRYVCDACTNIAGVSSMPFEVVSITCHSCGKTQECKKENWIKL